MKTRAAVAFEAKKPLEIVEVDLEGPKAGEVLVEIKATGICHTDAYTLDGLDSEGIFPSILGHEGAGIVREVGAGVISVKPGDHVIPLYTPECRQCKGLMPDGTTRFGYNGKPIFHYMGCSTFSNFTVLPEIAVAKIRDDAPFDKSCYIGCGVTTGVGAVVNTPKGEPGAKCVVFGLGGVPFGNEFEVVSDEDAYQTLEAAWNAGVRYYDVAPWYGLGLGERRYGNFLHNKNRDGYVLSSKVGKLLKASPRNDAESNFPFSPSPNTVVFDYTADGVRRSVEE